MVYSQYNEWIKPEKLILIQGWRRDGLTEKEVAQNMGITQRTLDRWKAKERSKGGECPLSLALKIGKQQANFVIENVLYKKAKKGNMTAVIFYLKNNWRDKYNDSQLSIEEREKAKQQARKLKAEADLAEYKANLIANPDSIEDKTIIIDDIGEERNNGQDD